MKATRWFRNSLLAATAVTLIGGSSLTLGRVVGAQDATPVPGQSPAVVSVSGMGMVTITPDAASISVGVNVMQKNLSEAQAAATSQMETVIATLTAAGVDEKDIQTSNYSVSIMQNYDNTGYPSETIGFQVNNQVNVTVRELDQLGDILDRVVAAGANSIYGISFIVTDSTSAASQARAAAIADAMAKAEEIAAATGTTLGRLVSVSESYSPSPMPIDFYGAGGGEMAADSMKSAVPVQSGGSIVQVSVMVTYELDQE